ncbi:MAG: AAA family ATPase [Nitrospirae bacterium]|nr:AAA family ATPase [Nitrospirota bacterium]
MYKEYFGLEEMPFSIAPDPRYLYMSEQHREALAHLVYGFNSNGGFVLLTGEVGTGKTTVCRCLLEQTPQNSAIAFIINPKLTVEELLAVICDEFGIEYPKGNASIKIFVDSINNYLFAAHAKGQKAVLIIDEAQNLSADVLEQLRLLTNLETNRVKLLQIILLGQPELRDKLSQPELRQLSQRIIARYHLGSLSKKDVAAYVAHRLTVAGVKKQLFADSAVDKLYRLSGGVPRLINVLCDRALLGTFAYGKNEVSKSILIKAANEVLGKNVSSSKVKNAAAWALVITVFIVGVVLAATYYNKKDVNSSLPPLAKVENTPLTPLDRGELNAPLKKAENHVPPQMDKLEWPGDQLISRSNETAFQALFKQWDIAYTAQGKLSTCELAKTHGLRCLNDIGSLTLLRQLNSPAVLKLNDKGRVFYAALTALEGETASLTVGTKSIKVAAKEIESKWLGGFTLLWRTPSDYKGDIHPGDKVTVVQWVNKQLSTIQGRLIQPEENLVYNNELVNEVKKFQLSEGLKPDGIIGPHTIIHLNNAAGGGTPVLNAK